MTYRLYEGKEHASSYWKYRISPSDHLLQEVLDFLEKQKGHPFELAVDVGCGSGQGTVRLAKHFASVIGTDVSPAQVELALQHTKEPNITYRQGVAEELPVADGSVDLITAMSAFHWFDRPRFLKEAHRVLKPRGCLALLNYTIDMELSYPDCCSNALNQVCKESGGFEEIINGELKSLTASPLELAVVRQAVHCLASVSDLSLLLHTGVMPTDIYALHPYRSPHLGTSSIELYREAYKSIPYPDKEWHECVWVKRPMPLSSYMGLVESFSSYQALLREDPQKAAALSQDILQRLMSIMGVSSAETEVVVAVNYFYLLACKP